LALEKEENIDVMEDGEVEDGRGGGGGKKDGMECGRVARTFPAISKQAIDPGPIFRSVDVHFVFSLLPPR
jgi:hypothetical protein